MNMRNFWLLGFLLLALVFGGLGSAVRTANATIEDIEGTDFEGQPSRNEFSIRGIQIWLEGDTGQNKRVNLGNLQVQKQDGTWITITHESILQGGHELDGLEGTTIDTADDEVNTNSDGEYRLTFILPYDILTVGDPDGNGEAFTTKVRFFGKPDSAAEGTIDYIVQVPRFDRMDVEDGDVFRNGDTIEFDIRMETFAGDEIEVVTLLPDFAQLDSAFTHVNFTGGVPGRRVPANWTQFRSLVQAVQDAIDDGRLTIEDRGNGRYSMFYTISEGNTVEPGMKRITLYAIDYPSTSDIDEIEDIFDAFGLNFGNLNITIWQTGVDDADLDGEIDAPDINLDNRAPNFDFAMINPFVSPPKAIWNDTNGNGLLDGNEWETVNYVYKPGDKVSVMVQIDPHDLTIDEIREVDLEDISDNGVNGLLVEDVNVVGDISALLDPNKVNLTVDANKNGIPDAAEVTAMYAGRGGGDDDFDMGDAREGEDDEDFTPNGFNERFIFTFSFTINENFKAASGIGPATVSNLPIRFMIEDRAGNQTRYSMWREVYNETTKKWEEVPLANWNRDTTGLGGTRNPVHVDQAYSGTSTAVTATTLTDNTANWIPGILVGGRLNPDTSQTANIYTITANTATTITVALNGKPAMDTFAAAGESYRVTGEGFFPDKGSLAFDPDVSKFPEWGDGHKIVANWENPWRIRIDAAPPSVSKFDALNLKVTTPDANVAAGAAVLPGTVTPGQNVLVPNVGTGGFVYEISGNESNLVTLTASFPSDNDVDRVEFWYSETDAAGSYKPMKGTFSGDRDVAGQPDIAGNVTDPGVPGAEEGRYHDGISGDDDKDRIADLNDREVREARRNPQTDGIDNDADGLVDSADDDDRYIAERDEDEDGIMDEDEYIVRAASPASWTFDPVRIARVLKLTPGKVYAVKAVAFDKAGNMVETAAAPIYMVFNVVGKGVAEVPGVAKAVLYKDGQPVTTKNIPENNEYTIEATITGTVTAVTFQYSADKETWKPIPAVPSATDTNPPFKVSWTPKLSQIMVDFPGYQAGDNLYIRAVSGKYGNLGRYKLATGLTVDPQTFAPYDPPVAAFVPTTAPGEPDITVAVVDTSAPVMKIVQAGDDTNLLDGALLAVAKDVLLIAEGTDLDIKKAVFQYAVVHPDGTVAQWQDIPSTVDLTILPGSVVRAVSKWDTTALVPGNVSKRYDLRCVAEDNAGNKDPQKAPVVHVVVGKGKYAAFITDPVAGAEITGTTKFVEAIVYNKSTDFASIAKVILQFRASGGVWTTFDTINRTDGDANWNAGHGVKSYTDYSLWRGLWDIRDLAGAYSIRALVEDDKGYINEGIEINVTIKGVALVRTKISNFASDAEKNPRVSMKIARDGSVADIKIEVLKDVSAETMRIHLKADVVSGSPDSVKFQYKINDPDDPKNDDPKSDADWTDIATDTGAPWEIDWDISATHPLHNLTSSKLVYIRAVATKGGVDDKYVDEGNYVPYVGLIFEETSEPTATIARIERDGVSLGDLSVERRVTGGTLNIVPYIVDQGISDHRASGVAKLELYYKHYRKSTYSDSTLNWVKAGEDAEPPFAITWNVDNIPTGKYELMLVATDQAGNKSANVWNTIANLRAVSGLIRVLVIDRDGPTAYVEKPDGVGPDDNGRLPADRMVLFSVSSYTGGVEKIAAHYSVKGAANWQRINADTDEFGFTIPSAPANVSTDFTGYYYWDKNGNDRYDAGEPIWKDDPRGNTGRYNNDSRIGPPDRLTETVLMGGPRPPDMTAGKALQDIPGKDPMLDMTGVTGTTKWADLDTVAGLSQGDLIWIDLDNDNQYDVVEPVVYAANYVEWKTIGDLPPTNNSEFDLRVKAKDLPDSAGKDGNWGPEYIGSVRVENIIIAVWSVNGRAVENNYDPNTGGGKDFSGVYQRTTGNTVKVVVRVYPQPIAGAQVQLWFRYDDRLYPGGIDSNFDGFPDNGDVANSKWDGIDNDWDGTIDEEQKDKDGNDVKWGEVNTWQLASTTGGTVVTGENSDENWFTVELTWDVSMLKGEFVYEFVPVVVDAQNFGVEFNYSNLPWTRSDAKFPQPWLGSATHGGYRIAIDHQGPYAYAQVVKDTADYGDKDIAVNSFQTLTEGSPDDLIVRTNDGSQVTPNNKRTGNGDYYDDPGEDNYRTYDIQVKTVSIVGGLNYTKTFTDQFGGVEFQYRVVGGEWKTLGYDFDPDYISTFGPTPADVTSVERGNGAVDINPGYVGDMIGYEGTIVNKDAGNPRPATAYAPRIIVATWSLDNIDIQDTTRFPWTNGTEYEFRAIARDLNDAYGNPGNITGLVPADTSVYDELVVENRVGDDHAYKDSNFLRDVNWKDGAPFGIVPSGVTVSPGLFNNPHKDIANLEFVIGPRDDGKDTNYWVDNIVPKAEVVRVGETSFSYTPSAGIDPASIANEIDATVEEGEDVLLEAIVNPDPENKVGASVWGTDAGDVAEVKFLARPHRGEHKVAPANEWVQVGMGQRSKSDYGARFTVRVDTKKMVEDFGMRDIELMAVARDDNGNDEPLLGPAGEIVIRISDMMGPDIALGGLALDLQHYKSVASEITGGVSDPWMDMFLDTVGDGFSDTEGLDLNNFGNAIFPANPSVLATNLPASWRRPVVKVSGEVLHLYVKGVGDSAAIGDIPRENVVISLIKPDGSAVTIKGNDVPYAKDTTDADGNLVRGKVKHTFTLSEQAALIYLPTWVENNNVVSRFEGVKLIYKKVDKGAPAPKLFSDFDSSATMTRSTNEKGEPIWSVNVDLELGQTYYYFFEVDTVGDNWIIPDPKNLLAEPFDETLDAWFNDQALAKYLISKNLFLNLPIISKLVMPGTPGGPDDELWSAQFGLSAFADGVYEVRVEAVDKAGFKDTVSKTFVLDRTPPAVDPSSDIKVAGRVKANAETPMTAIIKDVPGSGINVVETVAVLFEISRKGNTQEATSTWRYAISTEDRPIVDPALKDLMDRVMPGWEDKIEPYNWLRKIALDIDPNDGWTVPWLTPKTDQNVQYYVRAVPIDDALNIQVGQPIQVPVWVDGTVPKAKVTTASVVRAGSTITDDANGFELRPTDTNVVLTAEMTANIDGDLNQDGIIDPAAGENINLGIKGVTFQYSLGEKADTTGSRPDDVKWYTIPATQYSEPVVTPTTDGKWQVTWQIDFSKLYDEKKDQYIQVRAVAEDEVGNKDNVDAILSIMVLNNITGPQARILNLDGRNALSPHLAVTKRTSGTGDAGSVDVVIEAYNVASVTLAYRAVGATDWTEVKTVTKGVTSQYTVEWQVTKLAQGKYELRAIGYDADGNAETEPHIVTVVVDHSEPQVSEVKMWVDMDRADGFEGDEVIYPGSMLYRYRDATGYYNVKIEAKADATDPTDKVEAAEVVLQYFDRTSTSWVTVKLSDGSDAKLSYSKISDRWTKEFTGNDALGKLIPQLARGEDGKVWLRVLATDYAKNQNNQDKGFELMADANAPTIVAVYSGGKEWEGGNEPTIVAYGGDKVDLWAKVKDDGTGVGYVKFYMPASSATNTDPAALPVPATTWDEIGSGELVSSNGSEELWHLLWTTPLNMASSPFTYTITAKAGDKAGNSVHDTSRSALVKVEKDTTPPEPPKILFVATHAGRVTNDHSLPQILDEYNAPNYAVRKMLPIGANTDLDSGRADKYEVFDLYNDWAKGNQVYIDPDQYDTSLEIWVATPALEYGNQLSSASWRHYENYAPDNSVTPGGLGDDNGPNFIWVPYGSRDPGINRVYIDIAYDPNQDGDPSDITSWLPLDNYQVKTGRGANSSEGKYMDPREIESEDWTDSTLKKQEPLTVGAKEAIGKYGDVARVPLYETNSRDYLKGYAYYWVMGDDFVEGPGETVWNTEASVDDNNEVLDSRLGKDGIYFIRAWAEDTTGNGNPRNDPARAKFGYAMLRVHNQDNIPPANTYVHKLNGRDDITKWAPLEWKWHTVTVRTLRNQVGPWYFGGMDDTLNADTRNKFFGDIDYVVVEAYDNESGTWVNVTKDGKWTVPAYREQFYEGNRLAFFTEWNVPIDSTLVGDGNSKLRAYAVDNGGILVAGYQEVHNQHNSDRRNVETPDPAKDKGIMVDNPRAQVVLPATGTVVERGVDTLTVQAVAVSPGGDPARNGHDVGQVVFLARRKAASGGVNGPWILLDAKDNDLDGRFGEDPVAGTDYDKDGRTGEDGVDPSDTNEPYMVHWKVPEWLVIDDPKTETVIEQSAEYWIVAVAGDANTGPLDSALGVDQGADGIDNDNDGLIDEADEGRIHWDNPYHIIERTNRASLVTIVDQHPPRTRILQVDRYKVPSETKIVVGKTVTVFAGDTETDWIPPGTFPTPDFEVYPPISTVANPAWPADGAAWAIGMLYPPRYDPDVAPENQLRNEWRPDERVALRYAGPYADDAQAPAFPASGQKWEDTAWKTAEANAINLDDQGDPGRPDWQVTNWVTGGSVLPDGKYFIIVTATDDVGHTTGIPVGTAEAVKPDMVEIWIKNTVKPVTMSASELLPDGSLKAITNGEMERGQPVVLAVDTKMDVEDIDKVTFQFKAKHDYNWTTIETVGAQPYSVTLSPLGAWSGVTGEPGNIALGNIYQFKAVAEDAIGNKADSNIIELKVVDKVAMASIAKITRLDGFNKDEELLNPQQINLPRLTGRVELTGYTDADVVAVTFRYRAQGATAWTDIEAKLNRTPEAPAWDHPGYSYEGLQEWDVVWDTTSLQDGAYELAVVANTGENKSGVSSILTVIVDHNAYDIADAITDSSPKSGEAVGGWTRRPVASSNPILDPDQKEPTDGRGEVDIYVVFGNGLPKDLDMGVPTQGAPSGSALLPNLRFEYKESAYPNVGDETRDDTSYWKPITTDVVYDAATGRVSTVWRTVAAQVLNGYYDLRVRVVDDAGNVAYKVIAEKVIVDNTAPDSVITSVNGDTTLTYEGMNVATDTELMQNASVIVKATAVDALTNVAYVQFQVRASTLQQGPSIAGNADEVNLVALGLSEWTDIGLATKEADPKDSYSLRWDTTGLFEGDYLLRVKVTDRLGNMAYSKAVKVTVVDTVAPVATIVGYYPQQLQFLNWPKKYWFDTLYAATICQADVQEVQFQYRSATDPNWITIGVPAAVPFEKLDKLSEKLDKIDNLLKPSLFPPAVAIDEAIVEAFDWTGLWGTTWKPNLPDGTYQLRAVAKDWSGNVDPDKAPILTFSVVNGVVQPVTPASGIDIKFTANLGGTGVGATETPSVVITVEAPEKPTVLVLAEFDSPDGLVFGGEIVDVKAEEGVSGRYSAALKGDELTVWIADRPVTLPYLEFLRLGGKITAFASTSSGMVGTSLAMDDLRVFPVTAELGTNGTVYSKDKVVSVNIPRAALYEPVSVDEETFVERAGLMITPSITPSTPKDQRVLLEPVGQAYNIEMFNYAPKYLGFRTGFEPEVTIDYSGFGLPPDAVMAGFISVRYWDPLLNKWANDDIINVVVDETAKKVSFNVKAFGALVNEGLLVPHNIFSIVLEKALGRIDEVTIYDANNNKAFQYPADPGISYLSGLAKGHVDFRIVDPNGIDEDNIKVYIDGKLYSVGLEGVNPSGHVVRVQTLQTDYDRIYSFKVPAGLQLTEGYHTLKIEAWDKSDAVLEANWQMLEKTVRFYIDTTPPQVVTHSAQRDGLRYFSTPQGALASITIVDEGVGVSAARLQKLIFVDVFKWLTSQNTPLRTTDQGNVINYQRKVLQTTSKPILEYTDEYTNDGIDNEVWNGVKDATSSERHKAWRASYTVQVGQVADNDTYEVVFYATKPEPVVTDHYNENAVYLYEDLTRAYLKVWKGDVADSLSVDLSGNNIEVVAVPANQVPDFYKPDLQNVTASDPFIGYYQGTFLVDELGNGFDYYQGTLLTDKLENSFRGAEQFYTRYLVADTRGPVVTLDVPKGVRADDPSATISATVTDDASGIASAKLVINGKVVAEKAGPATNVTLEHTFGKGEAGTANEVKVVTTDLAGNETITRASFGVQEVDGPAITDMTPVGDGIADATPVIGAAYSDPSGIDLDSVTLTLNGAVITNPTVSASKVSYTPTTPLKAGVTYTVKVSVKDKAGTASEAVWTFSLEKDAPSITDTTPTGVDETGMPVISAKFSDAGTGVDKGSVKLTVDGKAVEAEVTESSVSYKPASVMTKGKHTAGLSVADLAGNVAKHSWEFSIEEVAPSVTDVMPTGTINDDKPVLSAKYSDAGTGIDLSSVTMTLNGKVVEATVGAGQVSYSVQEALKAGVAYTVAVTVADKAGNVGSASSTFRLESTAPVISGMTPTGTVQTVDVAVSANYSDAGSGIDQSTALMKLDGVVVPATPSASGISYQATGLLHGDHTVYVEVADRFGNVASQSWTFKVEETPPVISSVEPKGEINTATPVLRAAYSDAGSGINVSSVVLSLNGQVLPATATASQVSYTVLTPLERGVSYRVAVQVADKAGNIASSDATFALETTPPKISSTKPTGKVSEADAAKGVQISANLSDDGSGVNPDTVRMWLDGALVGVVATAESAKYTAKGLGYGEHNVRLVVSDMLGNTAEASWKFSVDDSTPPNVTVISPKQDAVVGVRPVIKISYSDEGSGVDLTSISVKIDDKPVTATAMAPAKPGEAKVVSAGEASYEVKLGYGRHTLTVSVKDVAGNEATAEVKFMVEGDALEFVKPHNYPNPFKGDSTNITFGLSKHAKITIKIYDFTGTLVATPYDEEPMEAAEKVEGLKWDGTTDTGKQLANGIYFCQIIAKTDSETKSAIVKIALVRE